MTVQDQKIVERDTKLRKLNRYDVYVREAYARACVRMLVYACINIYFIEFFVLVDLVHHITLLQVTLLCQDDNIRADR